jgi:hypothetical protein
MLRTTSILLIATLVIPGTIQAQTCWEMTRDLAKLRQKYVDYVHWTVDDSETVTFEGLVAILDEIIEMKNKMRAENCKIPPRKKPPPEKKKGSRR